MLAACYQGVEQVQVLDVPDPVLGDPTDAIVRVRLAGLCGSDLHLYHGRESGADRGLVMGHEFVGQVVAVGEQVRTLSVGDSVCCPFTTSCGRCFYCQRGLTSRCESGQLFGWRAHGVGLQGGQAAYVRAPLADATLVRIPAGVSDELALLAGDNLSTAHFCADLAAVEPGATCAVIGCGAVGLLAIQAARLRGASRVFAVDLAPRRLQAAEQLGAEPCQDAATALRRVHKATNWRGADAVLELVGLPAALELAYQLVRPGGVLSVIGCHCESQFAFGPVQAYDKNLTIRTGRCPARHYMDRLLPLLESQQLQPPTVVTHFFPLTEAPRAYQLFSSRQEGCLKALLTLD